MIKADQKSREIRLKSHLEPESPQVTASLFPHNWQTLSWDSYTESFVSAGLPQELKVNLIWKRNAPKAEVTGRCRMGEGTELTRDGVNAHFATIQTTSWCSASSKKQEVLVQVKSFRGPEPFVHVCSRRKTVVTRGGSGQTMKDKKTVWFSSQAAPTSKNIMWSWQVLQCTREGGEPRSSCPGRFPRCPLRRQQRRRQLYVC